MTKDLTIEINAWYRCNEAEIPEKVRAKISIHTGVEEFPEGTAPEGIAAIIKNYESTFEQPRVNILRFKSRIILPWGGKETTDYVEMDRTTGEVIGYKTLDMHELKTLSQSVYDALQRQQ